METFGINIIQLHASANMKISKEGMEAQVTGFGFREPKQCILMCCSITSPPLDGAISHGTISFLDKASTNQTAKYSGKSRRTTFLTKDI